MWIFDSVAREGVVDLWDCDGGSVRCHKEPFSPQFYLHLPDAHQHGEMLEGLESTHGAQACTFRTIFGELDGYAVVGDRAVAEAIEQQTSFSAQLFNVDVRRDQQYMAEHGIFPCGTADESRFTPDLKHDLTSIRIVVRGNPARATGIPPIDLTSDRVEHLTGDGQTILADLFSLVAATDPHVILFSDADIWVPRIVKRARYYGILLSISRTGRFRRMDARSYWSYGRMEHKEGAVIPDGRILIDTEQSFTYREGGLDSVLMGARLSGLSPNLVSRFTPGTLISSYEVYGALAQGIVVPFRKSDAEKVRQFADLRTSDKGGMMFQPRPGVYEDVHEIDFTSLYPSIIVYGNLSPETVGHPERPGFLPRVLDPLLQMRIMTKQLKKTQPQYAGVDAILKWMLVTCFGYTGYRNAKFGRIEVHEAITRRSRDILLQTKDIAEEMGFEVLHGIVDCLWVQGPGIQDFKVRVERETDLLTEMETYTWLVFLPMVDGCFGAYNRYFGRLDDGSVKVRGIAARRHDMPEYVRGMQQEMLTLMSQTATLAELIDLALPVEEIYRRYLTGLHMDEAKDFFITRRISRLKYAHRCLEVSAIEAYRNAGIDVAPGMKISYIVRDAKRYIVDTEWNASFIDPQFNQGLLEKARAEIAIRVRTSKIRNRHNKKTKGSENRTSAFFPDTLKIDPSIVQLADLVPDHALVCGFEKNACFDPFLYATVSPSLKKKIMAILLNLHSPLQLLL
jgi:DNA polymerase I